MRLIPASVGVAILVPVLVAPVALSGPGNELGCGDLSPFGNDCEDGPVTADEGYVPDVHHNALGSVGKLTIDLWQTQVSGVWTDLKWRETCRFIVLEDGSPDFDCDPADPAEELLGEPVIMRCRMREAAPGVPPSGPWGCEADVAA